MTKHSIRWWGSLAIILVVIASVELIAYLGTSILTHQNLIFSPLYITESYENYQKRFLPTLGWPPPNYLEIKKDFYDSSGSRQTPAFPDPNRTPARISLYGDSYTEAWGINHANTWNNVLSLMLNCRVSNFGVAGYGTDQAYLRFLQNSQDPAEIVILGIFSENIKRNVNQIRNLIHSVDICQTKPRFILDDQGKLSMVPIPPLTASEYYEIERNPGRFFHHEFFLPDGPSGRQLAKFPYLWGMIKACYFLFKNHGRGDTYEDFFQPGHPSQGLKIMTAIIKEFCHSVQTRGKLPVIMIIPTHFDIQIYQNFQTWNYQPLLDRLAEDHVDYIDAGPTIIHHLNGDDPRTLYSPNLFYHLTEDGNRLLAQILYDFLTIRKILN